MKVPRSILEIERYEHGDAICSNVDELLNYAKFLTSLGLLQEVLYPTFPPTYYFENNQIFDFFDGFVMVDARNIDENS